MRPTQEVEDLEDLVGDVAALPVLFRLDDELLQVRFVLGAATVIMAMGQGRKVAASINRTLAGAPAPSE